MATLRDIRRRINSVKSTQQITKAMKMVAASKLRRAQQRIVEARPYAYKLQEVIGSLALRTDPEQHPLLLRPETGRKGLVIIAADALGNKDIVALSDGYRESAQSWRELLLDLKRRGLKTGPELAVGDGALGFWKALREVYGESREQRCWVHKSANVLNQMPKSLQARAKGHLQNIWMAETRADAEKAFDFFIDAFGTKYHKAAERLIKDRERLLSFYDFPAEH